MISSLYALGYHEQVESNASLPAFLKDLRRAAFARAYSADKNLSIFLGRPPRIHRKYCRFNLPGYIAENAQERRPSVVGQRIQWTGNEGFDYMMDTKWSALCALLKEDILDLFHKETQSERLQSARSVIHILISNIDLTGLVPFRLMQRRSGQLFHRTSVWKVL